MKFAKQLETESKDIQTDWRPYLIQYKKLKKLITNVVDEIEEHGVSVSMLHSYLGNVAYQGSPLLNATGSLESHDRNAQVEYYFTGDAPNIRPCIRFTFNNSNSSLTELLSNLTHDQKAPVFDSKINNETTNLKFAILKAPLEYQRSNNNTDFYTLAHDNFDDEGDGSGNSELNYMEKQYQRRNSTAKVIRGLTELTLYKDGSEKKQHDDIRSIAVELEQDDAFFYMLMTELQNAAQHQNRTSHRLETEIEHLEKQMIKVASPDQKSDMYAWRQIFSVYMDAQVFQGKLESDRSMRSVQKAKKQLLWFTHQIEQEKLVSKLKNGTSKSALQQFMALNTELITLRHYQALNQMAITKILKKHDKRSGLNASSSFPHFVGVDDFSMPTLTKLLYATMFEKLTTIIPQPDDYACPVCMDVAWRPIRLVCDHVFCVRCLIKAQKKNMTSCPMCRHPTAIQMASAMNLDESLQRFMLLYFPKEIKVKKRENEREQAIEDIETFTGRQYSSEQLARMTRQNNKNCSIM